MTLTRTDKMAAASAAAFLGLLAGESVLFAESGSDWDAAEHCGSCNAQSGPKERLRSFADTYYVGITGAALPVDAEENPFTDSSTGCDYADAALAALDRSLAAERIATATLQRNTTRKGPERENL